jgi:hypothetical protein
MVRNRLGRFARSVEAGDDLEELSRYLCRDWEEVAKECKDNGLMVYE